MEAPMVTLSDYISKSDADTRHAPESSAPRQTTSPSSPKSVQPIDQNVVAIQRFIVDQFKLPIGKDNKMVPDGGFGFYTNESLKTIVNMQHDDPSLQALANKLKSYVLDDYQMTAKSIPQIANVIAGGGSAPGKMDLGTTRNYNMQLELRGAKVNFPMAYALVHWRNLENVLTSLRMLNPAASKEDKVQQLNDAMNDIIRALPEDAGHISSHLLRVKQALEEQYSGAGNAAQPSLMELLRNKWGSEMAFITPGSNAEKELSAFVFTLNTVTPFTTDPTPQARIKDARGLGMYMATIYEKIRVMRRKYGASQ
jgi:hypothetical protein